MKFKFLMTAALAIAMAFTQTVQAAPVIGEAAPEFTATDTNGVEHNLSDFRGKNVVLEWSNHQCPFVVKHYESGNMQKLQAQATENEVVWLTIVSSAEGKQGAVSADEANKIMEETNAKSTARILDPSGEIANLYDAKTTPHMFVINKEGVLVYEGAIDSDSSFKQSSIEGATNYVTAALESLDKDEEIEVTSSKPYGCSIKY